MIVDKEKLTYNQISKTLPFGGAITIKKHKIRFQAFAISAIFALVCAGVLPMLSKAQETEPPYDLPLVDATATVTPTTTATTRVYSTPTSTISSYSYQTATASVNEISAEDEAETGAEIYILAGLSLISGVGIYFIKKYIDIKRYSI